MAELLPTLSSDEEGDNPVGKEEDDDDEEEVAMNSDFQFGGVLVRFGMLFRSSFLMLPRFVISGACVCSNDCSPIFSCLFPLIFLNKSDIGRRWQFCIGTTTTTRMVLSIDVACHGFGNKRGGPCSYGCGISHCGQEKFTIAAETSTTKARNCFKR
jgi:hypothetical protein